MSYFVAKFTNKAGEAKLHPEAKIQSIDQVKRRPVTTPKPENI